MGLYEALWSLSMFGVFLAMDRRAWTPGIMVSLLGVVYGPVRFAMDYLRPESTDARYLGFTPGQYWAALFTVVCIGFLVSRLRSSDGAIQPDFKRPAEPPKEEPPPEAQAGG